MNRTAVLFAALALAVAGVAVPAAGSAPTAPAAQLGASNGTAEPAAPGARLAGVVAVQGAEVRSDLAGRAFGIRIAQANSNGSKAAVVAERVTELREQLADIEARRQALEAAREDGNLSRARYNAELAALAARSAAVDRGLARTTDASTGLPAELLEERGVNASAIVELRTRARDLHGPEVADIARSIAGPGAGLGLSDAGNDTVGPPHDSPTPRGEGPSNVPTGAQNGDGPADGNVTVDVPGAGGAGP